MENEDLCQACQALFVEAKDYQMYRHTLGGFPESATNGCRFCAIRWDRLSREQRNEIVKHEHRIEVQHLNKSRTLAGPMLRFRYELGPENESRMRYDPVPLVAKLDFSLIQIEGRLAML